MNYLYINIFIMSQITNRETKSFASYLKELRKLNPLSNEEREIIAQRAANGSTEAKEELIKSCLRYVITIAKKYQMSDVQLEDLVAEGNIGLIKSIDTFESGKGAFLAWAKLHITREIIQYLNSKRYQVKFSRSEKQKGNEPLNINSFSEMLPGFDDMYFEDLLPGSTEQEEAEDEKDHQEQLRRVLLSNIQKLKPELADVIRLRYYDNMTMEETGKAIGITREAVRLRENKAIQKLRDLLG